MTRSARCGTVAAHHDEGGSGNVYERQLVAMRGRLPLGPLGARELAQLARNPRCDRLLLHRASKLDPATVVREILRGDATEMGSRLALATGITFEHVLLRDAARLLFDLYMGAGRLAVGGETLVDVQARYPDTDPESLLRRKVLTHELLVQKLRRDRSAPVIIWHPRLTVSVDGLADGVVHIEPDFLVAGPEDAFYRPGEVKSYKDRGPRTNATELGIARLQGALEVLALRATLRVAAGEGNIALGDREADALVPPMFDLVLRGRYGMRPKLRPLVVRREIASMTTLLGAMRGRVLQVIEKHGGVRLDTERGHQCVPSHLTEMCRDHCAFAEACHAEARAAGLPIVLGAEMEEAVGAAGTLPRLLALLDGREAPRGPDERRVVRAFREAQRRVGREARRAG